MLSVTALQDAIVRLYGAASGGQVTASNLSSYSLGELQLLLDNQPASELLESNIQRANWIIYVMLNASGDQSAFNILDRFLNERPDLLQQKRIVVFALCAPFYLDATNISKLTAYYGLYDKTPQFVDAAAYLLFRELQPEGASPVSIIGASYDLNEILFPDPAAPIFLELDTPGLTSSQNGTLTPVPPVEFRLGDVIPVRTGVIVDHNGHAVPDGTPVSFIFAVGGEVSAIRQEVFTRDGIARTTFAVTSSGSLEIRAESETAHSTTLKFDIPAPGEEIPTLVPTETPSPTPEPTQPPTPTVTPTLTPTAELIPAPRLPGFLDWLMAWITAALIGLGAYQLFAWNGQGRWGVRAGLAALIGGLLVYAYLVLEFPGSGWATGNAVGRGLFLGTVFGALLGIGAVLGWQKISGIDRRELKTPTAERLKSGKREVGPEAAPEAASEGGPTSEPGAGEPSTNQSSDQAEQEQSASGPQ
jgi:beta-N-acetylhexosaminidase